MIGEKVIIRIYRNKNTFEDKVAKVGRKYVTTERGYRFESDDRYEFCLVNLYEYGSPRLLFKNADDLQQHDEKLMKIKFIKDFTDYGCLEIHKKIFIDKIWEIFKESSKAKQKEGFKNANKTINKETQDSAQQPAAESGKLVAWWRGQGHIHVSASAHGR